MAILSTKTLKAFPFSKFADPKTIQRGSAYYTEGRVLDYEFPNPGKAVCTVDGDMDMYTVEVEAGDRQGDLNFFCDCPYAVDHFCKHMVAAGLALIEHFEEIEEDAGDEEPDEGGSGKRPIPPSDQWRKQLDQVFQQLPSPVSSGGKPQPYAAALLMEKSTYAYQNSYTLTPFVVKAKDWQDLNNLADADRATIQDLLQKDREWLYYGHELNARVNPGGCLNLVPEAIDLLNFLQQYSRFYYGVSAYAPYFSLIAHLEIPLFHVNRSRGTIRSQIKIHPNPVEVQVAFTRENGALVLRAGIQAGEFLVCNGKPEVIFHNPTWVFVDDVLFSPRDAGKVPLLSSFPISIPEKEADAFRERYLRRVAEVLPVHSDLIQWRDLQVDPVPRLYLRDDKNRALKAELRFGYGEYETAATKTGEKFFVRTVPDTWELLRIHRQVEREQSFYQMISNAKTRLKRSNFTHPYGTFELRAHAHPFDFLLDSIPYLIQSGFEIYGEDKLKVGRINRSTPSLKVSVSSGIDWFDLKTVVQFGDQEIPFQAVRKALKRGERFVKLADGSVGQLPEEWLEKYRHLWNLGQETLEGLRISDFHLPLLDNLLEGAVEVSLPPDLAQRRERLRGFEQIQPQPLPQGFTGELRPYQRHGLDWLHFLREYRFGGILADDMGLGKTIQVLAYLQSLKEQGLNGGGAALLVVPKSLVTNWQRESEKFTPGLRFLEYLGILRNKDTTLFDDYDVVITTYGTLLRDVEILRKYRFHHAILDESQAIKNPLAKSARAARLLEADHRLVMTGTPVENNTFELWSQFAFLNPGLLGSMETFRHEFANPIESGQAEETAALLRRLIFPFILRRTKEQVATELPPRTERILYTEMDPAQKKLYAQTREHYRAELLGLIDKEGLADTRFKILEGLLRLRQIAIHPGLALKDYRGESPKLEMLLDNLDTLRVEGHKALIFSQFVEMLKVVREALDQRKIPYVYLDGQTTKRQEKVDTFQNDPGIPFFLISLKAGGVGLNLTAADYVIHLDPWWNPAVEMQASDRAHRIGQNKPVFVYKIIARDTVEEKILQLQEKKRELVKTLISSEASFFKSLTKDDVKGLFE